eukprot:IDg13206t1
MFTKLRRTVAGHRTRQAETHCKFLFGTLYFSRERLILDDMGGCHVRSYTENGTVLIGETANIDEEDKVRLPGAVRSVWSAAAAELRSLMQSRRPRGSVSGDGTQNDSTERETQEQMLNCVFIRGTRHRK